MSLPPDVIPSLSPVSEPRPSPDLDGTRAGEHEQVGAPPAAAASGEPSVETRGDGGSLRGLISAYREAGAGTRRKRVLVALLAANGLLEGFALTALIPALNAGVSTTASNGPLAAVLGITAATGRETVIIRSVLAFVVLALASAFATFLVGRLNINVRYKTESYMRKRMTRALLDMPWLPFLEMRLGDITKTTLVDASQTALGLVSLLQAMGTLLVAFVFAVIALVISPPMTAFTLAFGALAVVAYRRASGQASRHATELSAVTDELSRETTEVFGSFKYVRASGLTEEAWRRTSSLVDSYRDKSVKSMRPQTVVRFIYEGGGVIFVAGFLIFSLLGTSEAIGTSLVFLAVFYRLAPRITAINEALYLARILLPWYESWRSVHATARASAEASGGTARPSGFGAVSCSDVTFSYPSGTPVLSGVSVDLRRGTCTAVVGESGSGKTTLMDVLIGLLEPESGEVSVDGVPLRDVDRAWWHGQLGLVMQDSTMFSGSIVENVAIGDAHPDRDRVMRCLRTAAADRFVNALAEGVDSPVGERGGKISGGQRQRLALARAMYRDPGLLCLDEATSALDGESEALILGAVAEIKRDRAVLLVSHRVRTLSVADQIVVLENGRVAEVGSWDELMAAPTRFKRLVDSQS